jgi:hypothetical protein
MLVWQATNSGDFYVRTTNMAGVTGRHTEYDIQLQQELRFIQYIPVVVSSSADKSDAMEKLLRRTGSLASTDGPLPDGGVGPLGVINHMCPDAYEVDDTWMTAAPVADGQTYIHSFDSDPVLYAADKDYMSFSLLPLQSITFTVTTVTNTLTMLEAYDAQGHSLGLTGTDELALLDMPGGTYYVSVSPLNSTNYGCANEVGYEIAVDFSPRSVQYVPFVIK